MIVTIGKSGAQGAQVCGEHFMATAEIMHKEWRRSATLSWWTRD